MTSPSEKHMEAADGIVRDLPRIVRAENKPFTASVIARALDQAEREGMRRAAEIVEEFGKRNGSRYECGLMCRDILSEIGDKP